jgi:hydroxymethylbilane synthase
MMMSSDRLILGTRGSQLALAQSGQVARDITRLTGVDVQLEVISTRGDRIIDRPLAAIGGKGLFTAELEAALRSGEIHLAVHSLKDLPTEDPEGLILGAIPQRADPRDALVGPPLGLLPAGAVVGTGSLRRGCQLKARRPDIVLKGIRGNVDTRLSKRDSGEYDAVVLAMAGLSRLSISRPDINPLGISEMIPAPGQGALGVQCSAANTRVRQLLAAINHDETARRITAERAFLERLGGGCNVAAGCYARIEAGQLHVFAMAQLGDRPIRRAEARGTDPIALGQQLADLLTAD